MTNLKEKLLSLDKFEDNNYLDFYCTLILNNLNTEKIKYKTQVHHAIPVLFYDSRSATDSDIENIKVNLTFANHILAHYYLCLASKKDTIEYFKLLCAFSRMNGIKTRVSKNQYIDFILDYAFNENDLLEKQNILEQCYKLLAENTSKKFKGKPLPDWHRAKISAANTGKHLSKERKKHLSEINIGKHHSEETKKKISKAHIGQKAGNRWMKKDGETKSVSPSEFDSYLAAGWTFGKAFQDSRRIKIKCIETGEIFESCQAADKKYHCYTRCAINTGGTAGRYHWEKI